MGEVVAALAGAVVGALATYLLDTRKAEAERRAADAAQATRERVQRATVATALLQDLRNLEPIVIQFYSAAKPAAWIGKMPPLFFDGLRREVRLFGPDSIPAIDEAFRRIENTFSTIASADDKTRNDDKFNYAIRCAAGFALQSFPDAKAALVAEGGKVAPPRVLDVVYPPALPVIPPRSFPDEAVPGKQLPAELK